MSLVLHYKFNEDTALLGTDSSGNSNTLVNGGGVVSISDTTYGDVAYFDGGSTSQMTLASPPSTMTGSSPRTFSYWVKRYNQGLEVIHGQSLTGADEYRVQFDNSTTVRIYNNNVTTSVTQSFTIGQWYHIGITFDGTAQTFYVNGVSKGSNNRTFTTGTETFMIGGSPIYAPGFVLVGEMLDFRVYDDGLSFTEIAGLYSDGPNADAALPVTVSPSVFFLDIEWSAESFSEISSYKVEFTSTAENSSTLENIVTNSNSTEDSTLSTRLYNLLPDSSYTLALFASPDSITYEQVGDSGIFSTLENVVSNIDAETLRNSEGVFDISDFEGDGLDEHMNTLFATGDQVIRRVNNESVTTTFVRDGGSYPLEPGVFSFPFSAIAGAGQAASLGTSNIMFDEMNDAIVIDGVMYTDGDSLTINGKIVTVYNI